MICKSSSGPRFHIILAVVTVILHKIGPTLKLGRGSGDSWLIVPSRLITGWIRILRKDIRQTKQRSTRGALSATVQTNRISSIFSAVENGWMDEGIFVRFLVENVNTITVETYGWNLTEGLQHNIVTQPQVCRIRRKKEILYFSLLFRSVFDPYKSYSYNILGFTANNKEQSHLLTLLCCRSTGTQTGREMSGDTYRAGTGRWGWEWMYFALTLETLDSL